MYHIIVNPNAGKKKDRRKTDTVLRVFREHGKEYKLYTVTQEGDATRIARELTSPVSAGAAIAGETSNADPVDIVVVGGDGTLHQTVRGIEDFSRCRIGLIPAGTGNDFAAAIGLPSDAAEAAELILRGETKDTDVLNVGGVPCINVAGMGMDVEVLVRCKKGRLKGKIKYLVSLVKSLFAFKGYDIAVESEGKEIKIKDALLATACNGRQIGGGIRICPVSIVDDGKIDVMTVVCKGKIRILKAFQKLLKGKILECEGAEHFLCDRVKFSPAKPCTVQLDGELYDGLDFDVSMMRGLKFYR